MRLLSHHPQPKALVHTEQVVYAPHVDTEQVSPDHPLPQVHLSGATHRPWPWQLLTRVHVGWSQLLPSHPYKHVHTPATHTLLVGHRTRHPVGGKGVFEVVGEDETVWDADMEGA